MDYTVIPDPIIAPRIETKLDYTYSIIDYGIGNLYPQIMEEVYKKSPLTKAAIHVLTDFIDGEGFTNSGDESINRYGQTWNDILHYSSFDFAVFNGFAVHLNFDGGGNIIEVQHVPFEYIRLSLPNDRGEVSTVKVSNNWESDTYKLPNKKTPEPVTFPLYNPLTAAVETIQGGNGQILYYTPQLWTYPLASFDAVREAALTDAEIQTFMFRNIINGFLGTSLFKFPGGFDTDEEKSEVTKKIQMFKGAYNAGAVMLAETPEDFTGNLIENVPALNNDRLFEQTGNKVRDLIIQNYGMPPPLIGVQPEGGVFTQAAMRDSYIYYNTRTKNQRNILSRVFASLNPSLGDILPNNFEYTDGALATQDNQFSEEAERSLEPSENEQEITTKEGKEIPEGTPKQAGAEVLEENKKAQANLRGSVGGVQGILEIQKSVTEGITSYDSGLEILMTIYGFSEEQAKKILGDKAELEEKLSTKQEAAKQRSNNGRETTDISE